MLSYSPPIQEKIPETQSYLESGLGVKRIISCIDDLIAL
jgi:hypothetical protein